MKTHLIIVLAFALSACSAGDSARIANAFALGKAKHEENSEVIYNGKVYDDCIGTTIMGECHGTAIGRGRDCIGAIVLGKCRGGSI